MRRIIITAANGFIGSELCNYFAAKDYQVIALVRKKHPDHRNIQYVLWDGKSPGDWIHFLDGAEAIINLAGKSVNCRYNEPNKAEICRSRLESTKAIGEAISSCGNPPGVWLNASSATIYTHSLDCPNTEEKGIIGTGFSVDVCQKWEAEFFSFSDPAVRQIALRTAIVLGNEGGVMRPYRNLTRFGLGGEAGDENQQFSWIHIRDLCRAVEFLIDTESLNGAVNISSPFPVRNREFMSTLRKTTRVIFGLPNPKWLLKIGAWLIGTETELLLKSRFVLPEKLLKSCFEFDFPLLGDCLTDLENGKKLVKRSRG